jgi:F0F1-type ATP synthase membrane subunit c/vacuolar-type H+-ATPase subunit K
MSLRTFHLVFIALSVILTAFMAAWSVGMYRTVHDVTYMLAGVASLGAGLGLGFYGAAFQRKTRSL